MEHNQYHIYIFIYALLRVFREATGKQRFRETFRGASATAVPASTKVLELTSLTKLFLGGFDRCSFGFVYIEFMGNLMTCDFGSPIDKSNGSKWFKKNIPECPRIRINLYIYMYITYTIDSISYCIHTQHTHIIRNMTIVYIYILYILYYIYIIYILYIL